MSLLEVVNKKVDNQYLKTEEPEQIYLFEIKINFTNGKKLMIRKIKNTKIDKIISLSDNLSYYKIDNILLNIIDFNKPSNKINLNIIINKKKNSKFIKSKKINLEISKITLDLIEINYHILF